MTDAKGEAAGDVRFGGGNTYESYDLAAAWGAYRIELRGPARQLASPVSPSSSQSSFSFPAAPASTSSSATTASSYPYEGCRRGFFFITGDEAPYAVVRRASLLVALGLEVESDMLLERVCFSDQPFVCLTCYVPIFKRILFTRAS